MRRIPYSWVVVALSFVTVAASIGIRESIIILFPALLEQFPWSRTVLSVAPAIAGVSNAVGGLLIGSMADKRDLRVIIAVCGAVAVAGLLFTSRVEALWQFYLFYGVFVSIGIYGLGTLPHTIIITRWFPERSGTVIGIVNAGFGAGMVVFMPLIQRIVGSRGWRNGYLALAIVLIVLIPLVLLFQRAYPHRSLRRSGESKALPALPDLSSFQFMGKVFRAPRYWFCFVQYILGPLSTSPIIIHQAALLRDTGISPTATSWIVALYGIGMMLGMLASGSLSDKIGREKSYTLGTVCLLLGCISLLLVRSGDIVAPVFYAVLFGIGMGTRPSMDAATASDLFRNNRFALVLGTLGTAFGIGQFLGPVLAGWTYDSTGSYQGAIVFCMIAIVAATFSIWLSAPRKGAVKIPV